MVRDLEDGDPRRIGTYALLGRLGAGAMGVVYLGQSPGGRLVAVKVVRPGLAQDPGFRERFGREIALARRVGGFWTAAVVDGDPDAGTPWLATEYVPGPTLQEAVAASGRLAAPTVLRLAAGLAEALAAVHAAGLVHRDVKPSNVLLAADGPRLIDFGISRALDDTGLTALGSVVGTPGYLAPERLAGDRATEAGNVFSLGCVVVFAGTGVGPFGRGDRDELVRRTLRHDVDVEVLPAALRPLATACLQAEPELRPTAAEIVTLVPAAERGDAAEPWLPGPVRELVTTHSAAASRRVGPRAPTRAQTAVGLPSVIAAAAPREPVAAAPPPRPGIEGRSILRTARCSPPAAGPRRSGPPSACWAHWWDSASRGPATPAPRRSASCCSRRWARWAAWFLRDVAREPVSVRVDGVGLAVSRGDAAVHVAWPSVVRVGVAGWPGDPWLVLWVAGEPQLVAALRRLHLPVQHGGIRVLRVGAHRLRRARIAETRQLHAALAWHAPGRYDPRL